MANINRKLKRNKQKEEGTLNLDTLLKDTAKEIETTLLKDAKELLNEVSNLKAPFKEIRDGLETEEEKKKADYILSEINDTISKIESTCVELSNMATKGLVEDDLTKVGDCSTDLLNHEVKLSTLIMDFHNTLELKINLD